MNILLNTLGDPTWQVFALVIALAAPVFIVAVRTRDVHASEQQKRRDTLTILRVWLAAFLLMSGVAVALHLPDAAPQRTSSTALPPIPTLSPTPAPTSRPTSIPTPTSTPRLAHSITQVLTTFCDAITTQDYQTAWNQYAPPLQHTHSQPETFGLHGDIPIGLDVVGMWTIDLRWVWRTRPGRLQASAISSRKAALRSVGARKKSVCL